MSKFKKGDRVRRVLCGYMDTMLGEEYVVSEVCPNTKGLYLEGLSRFSYSPCAFELVSSVPKGVLPEDSAERKTFPLVSGLLDYFPSALAAVAHHSYLGNEKHNPGQPLHWARSKSSDHLDAAVRHILERDLEGAAWRILAALQMKLESEGAPVAPAAK